VKDALYR